MQAWDRNSQTHKKELFKRKDPNSFVCQSPGSYLGQIGADEPASITTLCVELLESQSEHQFVEHGSSTYRIKACRKRESSAACIPVTLLPLQHLFSHKGNVQVPKELQVHFSLLVWQTIWNPCHIIQARPREQPENMTSAALTQLLMHLPPWGGFQTPFVLQPYPSWALSEAQNIA